LKDQDEDPVVDRLGHKSILYPRSRDFLPRADSRRYP
jgi:hypothetical protein